MTAPEYKSCFIRQNLFGRWIVVCADDKRFGWSGRTWVPVTPEGFPVHTQVSNFDTFGAAAKYVGEAGLLVAAELPQAPPILPAPQPTPSSLSERLTAWLRRKCGAQ